MSTEVAVEVAAEVAAEILAEVTSRLRIFGRMQELPGKL